MAELAMIVAVASNGVIGRDNQLPWHIPEDLKWFKQHTLGKPMIMGRKTFESFGGPLPGRPHIVVSRDFAFAHEAVEVVGSLEAAEMRAQELAAVLGVDEIMVVGGAEVYRQMLPKTAKIYRTLVDLAPQGDTFFPQLGNDWKISFEQKNCSKGVNFFFQVVEKAL